MAFILFSLIILAVFCTEFYLWKMLTPNLLVVLPLYIICLLCEIFGHRLGFIPVVDSVYLSFVYFSLVGMISSLIVYAAVPGRSFIDSNRGYDPDRLRTTTPLIVIVFIAAAISTLLALGIYRDLGTISGDDYGDRMSHGLIGHALNLCMVAVPILLFLQKRITVLNVIITFITIVLLFLKQVKTWVIVPVVFYFLMTYYSSVGCNTNWKKILIWLAMLTIMLVLIFFGIYFVGFASKVGLNAAASQSSIFFSVISMHFLAYLFSGILGFSALFDSVDAGHQEVHYLFLMPYNIYLYITGSPLESAVYDNFKTINPLFDKSSNVFTIFGTLYIRAGLLAYAIYFIIISGLSLMLKFSALRSSVFTIYCFLCSFLLLGWFDYYYNSFTVYEGCLFILFFYFIIRLRYRS